MLLCWSCTQGLCHEDMAIERGKVSRYHNKTFANDSGSREGSNHLVGNHPVQVTLPASDVISMMTSLEYLKLCLSLEGFVDSPTECTSFHLR